MQLLLCLLHVLESFATFFASCAATIPLILLCIPLLARKETMCCVSSLRYPLTQVLLSTSIFGPLSVLASFGLVLGSLSLHGQTWTMPNPLNAALLPYTVPFLLWLLVYPLAFLLRSLYAQNINNTLCRAIPVILILLFFAIHFAAKAPFAGLPEGISIQNAFFAIFAEAWHKYFYSLFPCGFILLYISPRLVLNTPCAPNLPHIEKICAALACIGAFPQTISALGLLSGYMLRSSSFPQALFFPLIHTATMTLLLGLLLAFIFVKKRKNIIKAIALSTLLFDLLFQDIALFFEAVAQ